jgi:hypothetical protein
MVLFILITKSRDGSVGIALGYGLDDRGLGFDSRRGLGIFLFTTASRTALGPTHPRIQWVSGVLSLGVKRPGREADHSPTSSAEVKECVELYLCSLNTLSWCGAQVQKSAQGRLYLFIWITCLFSTANSYSSPVSALTRKTTYDIWPNTCLNAASYNQTTTRFFFILVSWSVQWLGYRL